MPEKKGFPWLRILVHLLGALPLVSLGLAAATGRLSSNPIQDIEQRLGRAALYFLMAALAVTPLATLTGWKALPGRRRALGLYAFLYTSLHFFTFTAVDYGFDLREVLRLASEKPFILLGLASGLIILPLAATSNRYFMRRLGRHWKTLHRLVYAAGVLAVLHFALARKGSLFALQGNILQPLLAGLSVGVLFILRLPPVRRWVTHLRRRISDRNSRTA